MERQYGRLAATNLQYCSSLEFLGIYVAAATQIPENLEETVPEFPKLRTISFGANSEEEDEIFPCDLLGIVKNAPALVNLVLPSYPHSLGGTASLIRQYGTKLRSLTLTCRKSMHVLKAKTWKDVCPNVSTLVIEDSLHWRDIELLNGGFPALRYLHLASREVYFLVLYQELLVQGSVPKLAAMHVVRIRPTKIGAMKNGRKQGVAEAPERKGMEEEEALSFLQRMAESRRIFLEIEASAA